MKFQIPHSATIFLLSVAIILISCTKEEILPLHSAINPATTITNAIPEATLNFENLEDALEAIDPDVHPDYAVAIKSFTCINRGESLLVYNPNHQDPRFYESRIFDVFWFKDSRPVRGNRIELDCVCKGKYTVVVINRRTNRGIGFAFHNARACLADASIIKTTDQ